MSTTRRRRSGRSSSAHRGRRRSRWRSTAALRTRACTRRRADRRSRPRLAPSPTSDSAASTRTSANVGLIEGGTARNIIPEHLHAQGRGAQPRRAKLADVVREMEEAFAFAAALEECEWNGDRPLLSRLPLPQGRAGGGPGCAGARALRLHTLLRAYWRRRRTRTSSTSAASPASRSQMRWQRSTPRRAHRRLRREGDGGRVARAARWRSRLDRAA